VTDRVDFYVLQSQAPQRRWNFACRLTAKAYLQNLAIVIWSESPGDAKLCDDLLWTFDDRSFVPHRMARDGEPLDAGTPVHVMLELESVERLDWAPGGGAVQTVIQARDTRGVQYTLAYELDVLISHGRWEVSAVQMDPDQ